MTVHTWQPQPDQPVVLEMCDHAGTLDIDHRNDVIRCTECECVWWPVCDWEDGWLGSHTRVVSTTGSNPAAND